MTNDEFNEWLDYLLNAYPDTRKWLSQLLSPSETLKLWQSSLEDCELRLAMAVVNRMIAGDIEFPAAYDRERLPAIVRKNVKQLRASELQSKQCQATIETAINRGQRQPLRPYVEQSRNLGKQLSSGAITLEAYNVEMQRLLRNAGNDPKAYEPRIYCKICGDTGVVHIWHPNEIIKARRGITPKRIGAAVSCSCKQALKANDVFDESRHFKLRYGTPTLDEQSKIQDWVKDKFCARHVHFDSWNERGDDEFPFG